ncbi:hypothetical protein [Haploplasma axanthum]|uniref:Uncharacterized protein n=1 Tax=Haploplasma axanthum TaxID=29552 RepID=A0A449BC53_HAPAX|nr:hypothetical protein [Haploplasma axanthum]VEU80031.1 Uncharacterised protein [Haploplasma axanthum]
MKLEIIYKNINEKLEKLNFEEIWPNFKKYKFAIYSSKEVCINGEIIPYNESFIGNTAIKYQDELIAIWNYEMDPVYDIDILTASLVHEMFHCFQMENGEARYPNDLEILMYPNELSNYQAKLNENKVLVDSLNGNKKLDLFVSIRNYRYKLIGTNIINEYKTETIEGTAEYVFLVALKQLSNDKYLERVLIYKENIINMNLIFDIRRISYYVGALYYLLLDQNGIDFKSFSFKSKRTVYELIKRNEVESYDNLVIDSELKVIFNELVLKRKMKVNVFKKLEKTDLNTKYQIKGYDPMNMFMYNEYIFCSHFILIGNEKENIYINQPVMLEIEKENGIKVIRYFK